jgi:hypothetical protein
MRTRAELAIATMRMGRRTMFTNLDGLTLEEALDAAGGYRSVLGILKHAAGWHHVYHSYTFAAAPRHWRHIDWPRGLRDTIEPSDEYLREVMTWLEEACDRWEASLATLPDGALDEERPCHWGARLPLFDIVLIIANHLSYHAGEINQVLALRRGHAWEYTEEVEENHIPTAGHRLRPAWMNDAHASAYEAHLAARDAELRGRATEH